MNIHKADLDDLQSISQFNFGLFKFERQFTDSYSLEWTLSYENIKAHGFYRKKAMNASNI